MLFLAASSPSILYSVKFTPFHHSSILARIQKGQVCQAYPQHIVHPFHVQQHKGRTMLVHKAYAYNDCIPSFRNDNRVASILDVAITGTLEVSKKVGERFSKGKIGIYKKTVHLFVLGTSLLIHLALKTPRNEGSDARLQNYYALTTRTYSSLFNSGAWRREADSFSCADLSGAQILSKFHLLPAGSGWG